MNNSTERGRGPGPYLVLAGGLLGVATLILTRVIPSFGSGVSLALNIVSVTAIIVGVYLVRKRGSGV